MASTAIMISAFLVCIGFFSTVNSDFLPTDYYRGFTGIVLDTGKAYNATASVTIDGVIANISTEEKWTGENITITIVDGGIGENHVTYHYFVPVNASLRFETRIYTSEDLEDVDDEVRSEYRHEKEARGNLEVTFMSMGQYRNSSVSKTEKFAYSVDDEVIGSCSGGSRWWSGEGNRIVEGGIHTNYLDVTLEVPEGINSEHRYQCSYVKDFNTTGPTVSNAFPTSRNSAAAEEGHMLYQTYHSMGPDPTGMMMNFDGVIESYESGMEWVVGTGEMVVVDGGVNYSYIYYDLKLDGYAYGNERSNYSIRLSNETRLLTD